MPPKVKITKEDIIQKALEIVRTNGEQALNARSIASALNCSTQPVFFNFATMEELRESVIKAAYGLYASFLQQEVENGKYPKYKSFGMAYIRFAGEEKELFKLLFMRDRTCENVSFAPDFDESVKMIMDSNGISREKAILIHTEMWIFVHGIGTMFATSFLTLEWETVSSMLTDIYQGLRERHMTENNENGCN